MELQGESLFQDFLEIIELIPIKCLLNTKPCLKGVAFGLAEINENILQGGRFIFIRYCLEICSK